MRRIIGTNAQFLAELLYFIWLLAVVFIAWRNNLVLLAALSLGVVLGFIFWHTREDALFFFVGAFIGALVQAVLTDTKLLQYANPGVFGVPYWVPLFFGGVMLFAKRFRDSFFEMEHWKKHYEKMKTLKGFERQIVPEIIYLILLMLVLLFLSYSNIAAFLFLLMLLMLQLMRWHTREDYLYALVLFAIGTLVEIIGTSIGIWKWGNTAIMGIPIWVGLLYKYMGLVTRRVCVTLNHRLFYKKRSH